MFGPKSASRAALCALLALTAAACSDGTDVELADVRVLLTDHPAGYIGEAMVDVGPVWLVGAEAGPIMLSEDGTDGMVDLLDLQHGVTANLANQTIPAGTYAQLRMVIEAASVSLAEGYEFNDGTTSGDLDVPSGAQTGIKLLLHASDAGEGQGALEIAPGETVFVVDFDVKESYVLQGNPETEAGLSSVSFKPTLRVAVDNVAGSISGTVSTALDGVSVEGLVVTAEPTSESMVEEYQTATASATVEATGAYTIYFVVPGEYEVTVGTDDGQTTTPVSASVTVEPSGDVTGIDFEIIEG